MTLSASIWKFLSGALLPRAAIGFTDNGVVALEVKKQGRELKVERFASIAIPQTVLRPDFTEPNIAEPSALANLLRQVCEKAGLGGQTRWSVALPEGAARSFVINFESKPQSRDELEEMIAWRVERVIGIPPSRLRLSRQQISAEGPPRYLVTAIEDSIMAEYESVFQMLGWHAGLIAPRHMGEMVWLVRDGRPGDKLLVSHAYGGFTAIALRGEEPLMVRINSCSLEERENDLFRLATYYRDKVALSPDGPFEVLVVGDQFEVELTERTFVDALGEIKFQLIDSARLSLKIPTAEVGAEKLAAPAGLAALAYN